jgi:5-methyltetrahydropteroyltriglutamate--homocysteine methyltransferase
LLPIVRKELEDLVAAGCQEISIDEPSMSCYAYREDPRRFVDIFNRTVETIAGRARVCTHLCFGNYRARAVGPRQIAPMFPAFLDFMCDEMHVEMASLGQLSFGKLEATAGPGDKFASTTGAKQIRLDAQLVEALAKKAPDDRVAQARVQDVANRIEHGFGLLGA